MKIALLGNNNNNLNSLTRYLIDLGYQATLFEYSTDPKHFSPESDTLCEKKITYKKKLKWGSYASYFIEKKDTIKKDLKGYNFFIGSGLSPAFLQKADIKLDIFIPTGGEIWSLPFFCGLNPKDLIKYLLFSQIQKKAIKSNVKVLLFDYTNKEVEKKITSLGFNSKNRIYSNPPFIYIKDYSVEKIIDYFKDHKALKFFEKIRKKNKMVIFHHSAHWWERINKNHHHDKGNNRLFEGFSIFLKKNPSVNACIITIPYGPDFDKSKKLCSHLGIEKNVIWTKHMPRKEVMLGIFHSDIVAGEFKNSWFSYGVVYEGLVMKKPVMHYRDATLYSKKEEGLYPMYSAHTPQEISDHLENHLHNPNEFIDVGLSSHYWFKKNAIERPLEKIVKLIDNKG